MRLKILALLLLSLAFVLTGTLSHANELSPVGDAELEMDNNLTLALAYEVQANKLDDAGKLKEAIAVYERSLELNPRSLSCLFNLGIAYIKAERVDEAVYTYERAAELAPNDAEVFKLLGIAMHKAKDEQGAVMAWQRSLEIDSAQPVVAKFIESNMQ